MSGAVGRAVRAEEVARITPSVHSTLGPKIQTYEVVAPPRKPDPLTDGEGDRGTPASERGRDSMPHSPGGGR